MHTAYHLKEGMFEIEVDGKHVDRQALLQWEARDRLGIVVASPFGAIGAGLMIMLAITAFYDMPGKKRRARPIYPDIYLFQVGRPWGNHVQFDFWPEYKEILLPEKAVAILASINSHAITHLLVPEGVPTKTPFRYKEKEAAVDRLKQAYLYSPSGAVPGGNIALRSGDAFVIENCENILSPEAGLAASIRRLENDRNLAAGTPAGDEARFSIARTRRRLEEVQATHPARLAALQRLKDARVVGGISETLRRIEVEDALLRLVS